MSDTIRRDLEHAVTRFDRTRVKSKSYNPYALGLYLRAVDNVSDDMANGATVSAAIDANFNDRLLTFVRSYMAERGHLPAEA